MFGNYKIRRKNMIWQVVSRNGIGFDPFSELSRMNRSMDQLFGGYSSRSSAFPPVNVWGGENEAVVTAEIPGVDPKSLSLSVTGDILTIEGEPDFPPVFEVEYRVFPDQIHDHQSLPLLDVETLRAGESSPAPLPPPFST